MTSPATLALLYIHFYIVTDHFEGKGSQLAHLQLIESELKSDFLRKLHPREPILYILDLTLNDCNHQNS